MDASEHPSLQARITRRNVLRAAGRREIGHHLAGALPTDPFQCIIAGTSSILNCQCRAATRFTLLHKHKQSGDSSAAAAASTVASAAARKQKLWNFPQLARGGGRGSRTVRLLLLFDRVPVGSLLKYSRTSFHVAMRGQYGRLTACAGSTVPPDIHP